ncbi:hypothetical protein [Aeromonas hydrophila]|uniref:hypothetical protein n=1 Tax=Aeromonas hydrophila TaxID=644 RepID=UPI00224D4461|nr:hypothetical protein [Aeromonas hydrophila]MCX4116763.1 hypothetical protein [Aeromonas hydrophila]
MFRKAFDVGIPSELSLDALYLIELGIVCSLGYSSSPWLGKGVSKANDRNHQINADLIRSVSVIRGLFVPGRCSNWRSTRRFNSRSYVCSDRYTDSLSGVSPHSSMANAGEAFSHVETI